MSKASSNVTLEFSKFRLDLENEALWKSGQPVEVEPQVLKLVAYLAQNPGRLVSREELIDHVWHGRFIADSTVSTRIHEARRALGDSGRQQKIIKTLRGRGLRFEIIPNTVAHVGGEDKSDTGLVITRPLAIPDKPSVAVLPFDTASHDEVHEFFADGVTEDVIVGLSRISALFVIARNSSFSYKRGWRDTAAVSQDLGVRYLVIGSARIWDKQVRVSAQLVDATNSQQIWSESFDGQLNDMLALQADVARSIVTSVHTQLLLHEGTISDQKRPDQQRVIDLLNRAWRATAEWSEEGLVMAGQLADRSLSNDPDSARAQIIRALVHYGQAYLGYSEDPRQSLSEAIAASQRAVLLAPNDEYAHWIMSCSSWCSGDHDAGIAHAQRATEISPNFSWAHGTLGTALAWSGQYEEGIEKTRVALRYNPRDTTIYFRYLVMALAHFGLGQYEDAVICAEEVIRRKPDWYLGHVFKIASLKLLGRHDDAMAALQYSKVFVTTIEPSRIDLLPFKEVALHELLKVSILDIDASTRN